MTDGRPPEHITPPPMREPEKRKRQKKTKTAEPIEGQIILPSRPNFVTNTKHRKEIDTWPGKSGNKPMRFSSEIRKLVQDLATWGIPYEKICNHVKNPGTEEPISKDTLKKYFSKELLTGANEGDRVTMRSMFTMIEGRPAVYMKDAEGNMMFDKRGRPIVEREEVRPVPAPAIWMSKVRPGIGLSEKVVIEHHSSQMKHLAEQLEPLNENDLLQLKSILAKKVDQQRVIDRAARLDGPGRDPQTPGEDPK